MSEAPTTPPKTDGKITIQVAFPNDDNISFRVKPTTVFGKIYESIAQQKGVSLNSFSLSFDGDRINRDQTPKMLEMNDGDQIDVQLTQVGGRQPSSRQRQQIL